MDSNNIIKAEAVVVGAGPGGYVAAIRLAQLGKKVVLVESDKLGGVCLNYGCIPSKAIIYASDFFHKMKKSSNMGISAENISLDFNKMQEWKDKIVAKLVGGINFLCKGNKIKVINGTAKFESSNSLMVNDTKIEFDKCVIATGSKPIEIPSFKYDGENIIGSKDALSLKELPRNMTVIGGGYIGLELGTVYAKLGTKVTVVEMTDSLLPGNDPELVNVVKKNLEKLGVDILLNAKADKFENRRVIVNKEDGTAEIESDKVLVAVGRFPNTKELGLEKTKVKLDDKGFIKVDNKLKSTDGNIYAIGDVSIGPMLAHKASHQGKFVAEAISGEKISYAHGVVPAVIFTDPEIATVGISEQEAKDKKIKVKIGKFPFRALGRAMTRDETEGFVKIIAQEKDGLILGMQIVGAEASDLISEGALAIKMKTKLEDLALTIHPHPTLSESLMEAAEATMGKAIHIFNPK